MIAISEGVSVILGLLHLEYLHDILMREITPNIIEKNNKFFKK